MGVTRALLGTCVVPQVGFLLLEVMVRGQELVFRAIDFLGFRDSEGRVAVCV